jgi:hypothetical protein
VVNAKRGGSPKQAPHVVGVVDARRCKNDTRPAWFYPLQQSIDRYILLTWTPARCQDTAMDVKPGDAFNNIKISHIHANIIRQAFDRISKTRVLRRREQKTLQLIWSSQKPPNDHFRLGHKNAAAAAKISIPDISKDLYARVIQACDNNRTTHLAGGVVVPCNT